MATRNTEGPRPGQKTALVTGASVGGIGGSLATELHRAGYFVFCAVRRPETATPLLQPGMAMVQVDVTVTESVVAAAKTVAAMTNDKLDVLINNAGSATHRPALDCDVDGVVAPMFDVNVLGVMRMVKAFSDLLINAKGCVVNIGSVAPMAPLPFSAAYNASKAALHAYGDTLHMEMKPFGVDVVTTISGGVRSNLVRESDPALPEGSRYLGVKDFWLRRTRISQIGGINTDEYARSIVKMMQRKKRPLWLWGGGQATMAWLAYYFLPRRVRLWMLMRQWGLNRLAR